MCSKDFKNLYASFLDSQKTWKCASEIGHIYSIYTVDNEINRTDHVTTIGDYLRSVALPPPPSKEENNAGVLHFPSPVDRKPSTDPPKCVVPSHRAIVATSSPSASLSSKDNCRDVKFLQKRAYEAQIAREEAMTKYYQLKMKKLELEIEQLQQHKTRFDNEDSSTSG
ncbi:unnamed protein product [Strongylus vulgaris]|uniref:Uncharacterized protein n=1 Tax=Strongylus vulgaris TaxID=40348 RepID=A0A3P7LHV1_STRVU|nr:unnamed protein product [Strongylus vulgaris]